MAFDRAPSLTYAFPIIAVGVAAADEADAAAADAALTAGAPCYYDPSPTGPGGDVGGVDYCAYAESLDSLDPRNAEQIPVDGVLVLQAGYQGAWGQARADHATVSVTLDGEDFPGALVATDLPGLLVWRPDAAWTPGATYHFTADVVNPENTGNCSEPSFGVDFDMTVAADPSAALTASTLTGVESVDELPIVTLESLACCPGAAPELYTDMCNGSQIVQFDPAQCAPLLAAGTLKVDLTGTPSAAEPTAFQLYYELTVDGARYASSLTPSFAVAIDKPFCATVTTHDVGTGAMITGPMACFGSDAADSLGVHPIAPPDSFTCSLRQCEIAGPTWDLDACTPLDPSNPNEPEADGEKGCSCSADAPAGPAALALAGLLGLALRRRSRK